MSAFTSAAIELFLEDLPADIRNAKQPFGIIVHWHLENWGCSFVVVFTIVVGAIIYFVGQAFPGVLNAEFLGKHSEAIRNLALALGGLLALPISVFGLFLVAKRTAANEKQAEAQLEQVLNLGKQIALAEQSQKNERFTSSVEQLGHDSPSVRMGAAYSLQFLGEESEEFHYVVIDVLALFIRDRSPKKPGDVPEDKRPNIDVQAALTVILDLLDRYQDCPHFVDLKHVDLSGAEMSNCRLQGVDFDYSILNRANLFRSDFAGAYIGRADFSNAQLQKASFKKAIATGTKFDGANLADADFEGVRMPLASFQGSNLCGASFDGALVSFAKFDGAKLSEPYARSEPTDFRRVRRLSQTQIDRCSWHPEKPPLVPPHILIPRSVEEK